MNNVEMFAKNELKIKCENLERAAYVLLCHTHMWSHFISNIGTQFFSSFRNLKQEFWARYVFLFVLSFPLKLWSIRFFVKQKEGKIETG